MSNVLDDPKQQQIRALGRLGWTLSRIQEATGIRRETISGYLKAAGIAVRSRGRPSESKSKPAISEEVSTDSGRSNPAISEPASTDSDVAKPATRAEVSTDSAPAPRPGRAPSASACEPYRELHRRGAPARAQRDGDLAGPRRRPWLHRPVRERPALRADAARQLVARGARRHRHRTR